MSVKMTTFRFLLPRVPDGFGGMKAREVRTESVQEFLDRMKDELAPSALYP